MGYPNEAERRRLVVADDTALARVAPVTHAHINSLGRYDLHREPPPAARRPPATAAPHR